MSDEGRERRLSVSSRGQLPEGVLEDELNKTTDKVNTLEQELKHFRENHEELYNSMLKMKQQMLKQERKVEIMFVELLNSVGLGEKDKKKLMPSLRRPKSGENGDVDNGEGVTKMFNGDGLATLDHPDRDLSAADTAGPKNIVGATGTSVPREDERANDVPHPPLRVLIPKDLHAKYSGSTGNEDLTNMAKECDCHLYFSSTCFQGTSSYILTAEKFSNKGDPSSLISMALNLMYNTSKVEAEILIPDGIASKMDKKQMNDLIQRSKADVHWSLPVPNFAEPDPIMFNKEAEKERGLKGIGGPQQILTLLQDIYTLQINRLQASKKTLNEHIPLEQRFEDEQTYMRSRRRAQYHLEKKEVQAKMVAYGLTEETTKDLDQDAIRQAKEILWETQRWRYFLLWFIRSKGVQFASFVAICLNMLVMWIEVDVDPDSPIAGQASNWQYFFTVMFLIEATINLIAIPQVWKHKDVFVDALVCYTAFVMETLSQVPGTRLEGSSGGNFLLLLRLVRFYRFFRIIKGHQGARTVRVIISGFSGAMLNLVWITLFLVIIFYCGAILFRSLLKSAKGPEEWQTACGAMTSSLSCANTLSEIVCQWRYGTCMDELSYIKIEYFQSVQSTMITLLDAFMEGFDHSTLITRPMIYNNGGVVAFQAVGWLWLFYNLFMKIIVANLIAGLFIEQLKKDAEVADEKQQKESLLSARVNFKTIEDAFTKCDVNEEKLITLADFQDGVKGHKVVQDLCQIYSGPGLYEATQTLFHQMDHRGEGTLNFSEFAYGILGHRCGSQSLDKMLFDNASKNLIRQSSQTVTALKETSSLVQQSSSNVHHMSEFMYQQRLSQTANLSNLQKNLRRISTKIDQVYAGLDLENEEGHKDTRSYSLMNLENMREAKDIQDLLRAMRDTMDRARKAAVQQAEVADRSHKDIYNKFTSEANKDIQSYLEQLRAEGSHAAQAASAAARAAAAIAAAASWPANNSAPRQNSNARNVSSAAIAP